MLDIGDSAINMFERRLVWVNASQSIIHGGVPTGTSVLICSNHERAGKEPFSKSLCHPRRHCLESEKPGPGNHLRPNGGRGGRDREQYTPCHYFWVVYLGLGCAFYFLPKAFCKLKNHSVMLIMTAWDLCKSLQCLCSEEYCLLSCKKSTIMICSQNENALGGSQENATGSFPWTVSPLPAPSWSRVVMKRLDLPQMMEMVGGKSTQ